MSYKNYKEYVSATAAWIAKEPVAPTCELGATEVAWIDTAGELNIGELTLTIEEVEVLRTFLNQMYGEENAA